MPLSTALPPELPYLGAFYAVATTGGFSAAARHLGCSQPSVSYQVRALERAVGATLFERSGRRVLLTPAGERLTSFCHDFFAELDRVRSACVGRGAADTLRLGSASGFGRYVLVPALEELRSSHQGRPFRLELAFDSADVVLQRLERGECEAAFVYSRRTSNLLRFRRVYDEELVLISSSAKKTTIETLEEIEHAPFVTYQESDYVFGRWFDATFGDQPSNLDSAAHFSELEEVIEFVARGVGLSIVPRDSVRQALAGGSIEIVRARGGMRCMNQVFVVQRAASTAPPELNALVTLLRQKSAGETAPEPRVVATKRRRVPNR